MRDDGVGEAVVLACAIAVVTTFLVVVARCAHEDWYRVLSDAVVEGLK